MSRVRVVIEYETDDASPGMHEQQFIPAHESLMIRDMGGSRLCVVTYVPLSVTVEAAATFAPPDKGRFVPPDRRYPPDWLFKSSIELPYMMQEQQLPDSLYTRLLRSGMLSESAFKGDFTSSFGPTTSCPCLVCRSRRERSERAARDHAAREQQQVERLHERLVQAGVLAPLTSEPTPAPEPEPEPAPTGSWRDRPPLL